jgi:hypothetical protein
MAIVRRTRNPQVPETLKLQRNAASWLSIPRLYPTGLRMNVYAGGEHRGRFPHCLSGAA